MIQMTREEALTLLHEIKDMSLPWNDEHYEALDIAIESLRNEGRETNFEHYFYDWTYDDDKVVITFEEDMTKKFLNKGKSCKLKEWLLKPYEPPKYKVSQFEYDLLECYNGVYSRCCCISEFWRLEKMCEKGYFKDIPSDLPIKDILDNCEVTEE